MGLFGMFGMGRRERRPGEPPPWFSPAMALHMSESDWQEFYAMLTGFLCECCTEEELKLLEALRRATLANLLGGPQDGQGAAA